MIYKKVIITVNPGRDEKAALRALQLAGIEFEFKTVEYSKFNDDVHVSPRRNAGLRRKSK